VSDGFEFKQGFKVLAREEGWDKREVCQRIGSRGRR